MQVYQFRSHRASGHAADGAAAYLYRHKEGRMAMTPVLPLEDIPVLLPRDAALLFEADFGDDLAAGEYLTAGDVVVQARDALLPGFAPLDVTVPLVPDAPGSPATAQVSEDAAGARRCLRVTIGPGAQPGQLYRLIFAAQTSAGRTLVDSIEDIAGAAGLADQTAPALPPRGHTTISQITVGTTAVLLLPANSRRELATIINNGSGAVLYIGPTNAVTVSNGLPVHAGQPSRDRLGGDAWWGIAAAGEIDVRALEVAY